MSPGCHTPTSHASLTLLSWPSRVKSMANLGPHKQQKKVRSFMFSSWMFVIIDLDFKNYGFLKLIQERDFQNQRTPKTWTCRACSTSMSGRLPSDREPSKTLRFYTPPVMGRPKPSSLTEWQRGLILFFLFFLCVLLKAEIAEAGISHQGVEGKLFGIKFL